MAGGNPKEPSVRRVRQTRVGPVLMLSAVLVVIVVGTWTDLLAELPNPLRPVHGTRWWFTPVERNAFMRVPVIQGSIWRLRSSPDTHSLWAVGANGLIIGSFNGGRTWVKGTLQPSRSAAATPLSPELPSGSSGSVPTGSSGATFTASPTSAELPTGSSGATFTASPTGAELPTGSSGATFAERPKPSAPTRGSTPTERAADRPSSTTPSRSAAPTDSAAPSPPLSRAQKVAPSTHSGMTVAPPRTGSSSGLISSAEAAAPPTVSRPSSNSQINAPQPTIKRESGVPSPAQSPASSPAKPASGKRADTTASASPGNGIRPFAAAANGRSVPERPPDLTDIHFLSPKVGVAVGNSGVILRTEDSGANWKPVDSTESANLLALTESADHRLIAVGEHEVILVSDNDGLDWSFRHQGSQALRAVIASGSAVLAVGNGFTLLRSTDNGESWSPGPTWSQPQSASPEGHTSFQFNLTAAAFTTARQLFVTGESGLHFDLSTQGLHAPQGAGRVLLLVSQHAQQENFADVEFLDDTRGFALTTGGDVETTVDGGQDWKPTVLPEPIKSLAKGDTGEILAAADSGAIFKSSDLGATWIPLTYGSRFWRGLEFARPRRGVIVGMPTARCFPGGTRLAGVARPWGRTFG
jgi:photosystem II stability/assembly factor-like uncharacterized protein